MSASAPQISSALLHDIKELRISGNSPGGYKVTEPLTVEEEGRGTGDGLDLQSLALEGDGRPWWEPERRKEEWLEGQLGVTVP